MKIQFHDYQVDSRLTEKRKFQKFLAGLFKKEGVAVEQVDFIFCKDQYLLGLNDQFLDHNFYTDTLTFLLSTSPFTGEGYISIDRVKENASRLKLGYQEELKRVVIHSALHLCGYNDNKKASQARMFNRQEKYLAEWKVSRETL